MGLSAFNRRRAEEAERLKLTSETNQDTAKVVETTTEAELVEETPIEETIEQSVEEPIEETVEEVKKVESAKTRKKTDAEKLRRKKE